MHKTWSRFARENYLEYDPSHLWAWLHFLFLFMHVTLTYLLIQLLKKPLIFFYIGVLIQDPLMSDAKGKQQPRPPMHSMSSEDSGYMGSTGRIPHVTMATTSGPTGK